jgi:hypothetical protein
MIARTYELCFRKESEISPLLQLEHIECEFERMYQQIDRILPQFVQEKQAARDRERREAHRTERQLKQEQELKLKIAAARERANKPAKRNQGRPLVPRTRPRLPENKENAKLETMRQ